MSKIPEQKFKIGDTVWYLYFESGKIEVKRFIVHKIEHKYGDMFYYKQSGVVHYSEDRLYKSKDEAIDAGKAMLEAYRHKRL